MQKYGGSAKTALSQISSLIKKLPFYSKEGTSNLDIGGGWSDKGTNFLRDYGITNHVFDPFNQSAEHNNSILDMMAGGKRFDTVTLANVLNVIEEEQIRRSLMEQAARAMKKDGKVYIQIYEGDAKNRGKGMATSKGYQANQPTSYYLPMIQEYFGNVSRKGNIITASNPLYAGKANWIASPDSPVRTLGVPVAVGGGALAATSEDASAAEPPPLYPSYDKPLESPSFDPIDVLLAPIGAIGLLGKLASMGVEAGTGAFMDYAKDKGVDPANIQRFDEWDEEAQ